MCERESKEANIKWQLFYSKFVLIEKKTILEPHPIPCKNPGFTIWKQFFFSKTLICNHKLNAIFFCIL